MRGLDASRLDRRADEDGEELALFADVIAVAVFLSLIERVGALAETLAKGVGRDRRRRLDQLEVAARAFLHLVVVALAQLGVEFSHLVERSVKQLVVIEISVALAVTGVDGAD